MRTKLVLPLVALCFTPLVVAENKVAYPSEKVAEFVIGKLDVTSLPSAFRPKKERGKKTFADYGFTVRSLDESQAIVESADGVRKLVVKILSQKSSGIYVCVGEPGQDGQETKTQSVVFVRRKDPNVLLKGHESFREFAACPVIGGSDSTADSDGGD